VTDALKRVCLYNDVRALSSQSRNAINQTSHGTAEWLTVKAVTQRLSFHCPWYPQWPAELTYSWEQLTFDVD